MTAEIEDLANARGRSFDELVDGMRGLYLWSRADFCVFEEDEGSYLDIEDMLGSCARIVVTCVTLIELLATKLDKACQREHCEA